MNALERNGSPKPEFETDDARSYLSLDFLYMKDITGAE